MALKTIYPSFPPIARGNPSVIKTDAKREQIIYANSRTVVIKNVADPTKVQLFTGHQYPVTAVAMSPSGCYMATGDKSGKLLVWACDTPEQIIKGDYPMLGGSILDIDWSPDNSRIVVVGEGQPPAKVIMWDSGNSVGEVGGGHIKKIVSCSYKPTRPFRVVTASEDLKVNFYEGPPFKFKGTAKSHERFPNCVRYSPDGQKFFSVGSDQMLSVFDGKESTLLIERKVHTGSIYSASWKLDSSQIVTCSADKSVKVIDASTLEEVASFTLGTAVEDMQIGCAFLADSILSYSLNGAMNFLDPAAPAAPPRVEWGHTTPVYGLCATAGRLFAGSFEDGTNQVRGVARAWDLATGKAEPIGGTPPGNRVSDIAASSDGLVVCAQDNTVTFCDASTAPLQYGAKVSFENAPKQMSAAGSTVAVTSQSPRNALLLIKATQLQPEVKLDFEPTCVSVAPNESLIAVGSEGEPAAVYLLDTAGGVVAKLERHKMAISALAFAPDCATLASGCANKEIVVWDVTARAPLVTGLQGFHTARLSSLAYSAAGVLASAGIDSTLLVWDLEAKKPKTKTTLCHTEGGINKLVWVDDSTIATAGSDACIKTWSA